MKCGLCNHEMTFDTCGFASVTYNGDTVYLCHEMDHDCYGNWTLWGQRPKNVGSQ